MHTAELMSHPVVTVHVNDPIKVAAQKMSDYDLGVLPVVNDEGKLAGVITDRDICMAACAQSRPLDELLVNSAMARHAIAVRPDQPLAEVQAVMAKNRIRRLPVVDGANVPIGVISLDDLATESARPGTRLKQNAVDIAKTLAAIARPHIGKRHVTG